MLSLLHTPPSTPGFSPYVLLAQCGVIHHLLFRPSPITAGQGVPMDRSQADLSVPSTYVLPDTMLSAQQGFQSMTLYALGQILRGKCSDFPSVALILLAPRMVRWGNRGAERSLPLA